MQTAPSARRSRLFLLLLVTALVVLRPAGAAPLPSHWVGSWSTANWDQGKATAPVGEQDTTLREVVHTTLAGPFLRIELSNEFGTEPLTIGSVHVALNNAGGGIYLSSANRMTFAGKASITIPPGAVVISDPAALTFKPGADLAISIFLPAQSITHVSGHSDAFTTNYIAAGNQVGRVRLRQASTSTAWLFLKSVDVKVAGENRAIVTLGDSITDGTGSTLDRHNRWVDVLAERLQADPHTRGVAVLNEGIGGNRILNPGNGPSALTRFSNDVLALPGVRYLILLEGINDIGRLGDDAHPGQKVTSAKLIQGIEQIVALAHTHGIQVFVATLTPFQGANYFTPEGDTIRHEVNAWIRKGAGADGVIDFAAVTRDPAQPDRFLPADQSGDHLHPSPAGYRAMGDAIDLNLFRWHK